MGKALGKSEDTDKTTDKKRKKWQGKRDGSRKKEKVETKWKRNWDVEKKTLVEILTLCTLFWFAVQVISSYMNIDIVWTIYKM